MGVNSRIDKSSPIPAYHQIVSDLTERFTNGEWKLGEQLPTESELCQEYSVSRLTLRQALAELERQRLITRHQGKGAFLTGVAKPFIENLSFPILGHKQVVTNEHNYNKVLSLHLEMNPPHSVLGILFPDGSYDSDQPLISLKRLFYRQAVPLGINQAWFVPDLVPDIIENGLIDESISRTLNKRYGYEFTKIDNYIEAVNAGAAESTLLNCSYHTSLLKIQSTYYIENEKAIEHSSTLWLGSLTRFHLLVDEQDSI